MFQTKLIVSSCVYLSAFLGSLATTAAQEPNSKPERQKVAILAFEGVELLDFAGPAEIFAACRDADGNREFDVFTVGVRKEPLESMYFLTITPKYDPNDAPDADIVVIPGGNVDSVMSDEPLMKWLAKQKEKDSILFSVCNGASVLAKMGILNGLEVATHHSNMDIIKWLEPNVVCAGDKRYIDHGKIVTTAGVSAGIDGALHMIKRLKGESTAHRSAVSAEFDYWEGFSERTKESKGDKFTYLNGRAYKDEKDWAVYKLLRTLHTDGMEAAVKLHAELLTTATGHDLEMIQEAGLQETGDWLLKHGRDQKVGLDVLRLVVRTHPSSVAAHTHLGAALKECGLNEGADQVNQEATKLK
jgi:putative intracellular protease/amidase